MKRIDPPAIDDITELQLLANNEGLGSYPGLMNEYIRFRSQYNVYSKSGGNPWSIAPLPISGDLKKALRTHYGSPPESRLKFIKKYRRSLSPTLCPMCGGFGNGTLDHYITMIFWQTDCIKLCFKANFLHLVFLLRLLIKIILNLIF